MMSKKCILAPSTLLIANTVTAGIRWEPESDMDDGEGIPDWIAFILLIIVVLMVFGKIK